MNSSTPASASGSLRAALETAAQDGGYSLNALTVLSVQNDPYRVDTPVNHLAGEWLATLIADVVRGNDQVHLRGLHYKALGRTKPNGETYSNTDEDWTWISSKAAKAARWLGYVPFERIIDARNSEPTVHLHHAEDPYTYVSAGLTVEIPSINSLTPHIGVLGFEGRQPYRLAMFGEKSSLEPVLLPLARQYMSDLYLPTGEISDTLMHRMARDASEDGRPLVVFTFADCDPAGWHMSISIGRKLQAQKDLLFPDLDFQVRRVALVPDQVREYGLPSTPLKEKERRADKWMAAQGTAQTEVDALLAIRPELLRQLAVAELHQFFDRTLGSRVYQARDEWMAAAQAILDDSLDGDEMERIRVEAEEVLSTLAEEIDALNDRVRIYIAPDKLPPIVIPEPELNGTPSPSLIDSRDGLAAGSLRLIENKAYLGAEVDE